MVGRIHAPSGYPLATTVGGVVGVRIHTDPVDTAA